MDCPNVPSSASARAAAWPHRECYNQTASMIAIGVLNPGGVVIRVEMLLVAVAVPPALLMGNVVSVCAASGYCLHECCFCVMWHCAFSTWMRT